jgi:hypothetical protein
MDDVGCCQPLIQYPLPLFHHILPVIYPLQCAIDLADLPLDPLQPRLEIRHPADRLLHLG